MMTVFENDGRWDASNAVVTDSRVTRYEKGLEPRPPAMRWIDYGLSVLTRPVLDQVTGNDPQDLGPLFSGLAGAGRLAAFEVDQRFFEIGTPDSLAELETRLARLNGHH
jgi:NDP-sugar pyrophosphorylase family protein